MQSRVELQLRNRNPNSAARLEFELDLLPWLMAAFFGLLLGLLLLLLLLTVVVHVLRPNNSIHQLASFSIIHFTQENYGKYQRIMWCSPSTRERAPRSLDAPLGAHRINKGEHEIERDIWREREMCMCIIIDALVSRQGAIIAKYI